MIVCISRDKAGLGEEGKSKSLAASLHTFVQIHFDENPLFLKPIELWQNLAYTLDNI